MLSSWCIRGDHNMMNFLVNLNELARIRSDLSTRYAKPAKWAKLVKKRGFVRSKGYIGVIFRFEKISLRNRPSKSINFHVLLDTPFNASCLCILLHVPFEVISWCCRRHTTHWKVFRKASTLWKCINFKLNRIPFWKGTFVEQKLCFLILENSFDVVLLNVISFDFDGKLSSITHTHSISNWWFRDFRIFCKSLKNPTNIQ